MRISASDSALHCGAMAMVAQDDVAGLFTNSDRDRRSCREAVAVPHRERRCVPGHCDSATPALFVVRSYDLDGDRLLVRRLLWLTIIDIRGLTDVWRDPSVLRGSVRVFGNG